VTLYRVPAVLNWLKKLADDGRFLLKHGKISK